MVSSKLLKKTRAAVKESTSQAAGAQESRGAPPSETEVTQALVLVDPSIKASASEPGSPNPDLRSKRRHDPEEVPIGKRARKDTGKSKALMIPRGQTGQKGTAPPPLKKSSTEPSSPGLYLIDANTRLPDPLVRPLEGVSREASALFSSKSPSSDDLRLAKPPSEYCLKERQWFDTLPMDLLHLESMRYMEMMRMGIAASWRYGMQLEEKCRRMEQGEGTEGALRRALEDKEATEEKLKVASAKVEELSKSSKELASSMKKKVTEAEGKATQAEKARVELERELKETTRALADAKTALTQVKKEQEDFKREFTKSEEFETEVVKNIIIHWEQGVRVGVRQAVAKYGSLDPSIVFFEPNYEDYCGEPGVESDGEADAVEEKEGDGEGDDDGAGTGEVASVADQDIRDDVEPPKDVQT